MLYLVIAVIALGWAAFGLSYGRDRLNAKAGFGLPPSPYMTRSGPFSAPRTAAMARMRRQQILSGLIVACVLSYFMTRLWSVMWGPQVLLDIALIAYAGALYARSLNPQTFSQSDRTSQRTPHPARWVESSGFAGTSVLSSSPRSLVPHAAAEDVRR